jgi:hypothetical protein
MESMASEKTVVGENISLVFLLPEAAVVEPEA